MNLEKKVKLQQNIINDLVKDKEILQKKVEDLQFELNYEKEVHKNSKIEADKLIHICKETKNKYDKCIEEVLDKKRKYEESLSEINKLKLNYKFEINALISKFQKSLK